MVLTDVSLEWISNLDSGVSNTKKQWQLRIVSTSYYSDHQNLEYTEDNDTSIMKPINAVLSPDDDHASSASQSFAPQHEEWWSGGIWEISLCSQPFYLSSHFLRLIY